MRSKDGERRMTKDEAISLLNIHKSEEVWADDIAKAIDIAIEALSAERVGKWVERHPMRYDGKFVGADTDIIPDTRIRHLYCGECDKQMPIFEKFPYCPYCGAKMVNRDAE